MTRDRSQHGPVLSPQISHPGVHQNQGQTYLIQYVMVGTTHAATHFRHNYFNYIKHEKCIPSVSCRLSAAETVEKFSMSFQPLT